MSTDIEGRIAALLTWLRTEDKGNEYDSEAVAALISEWIGPIAHEHHWIDVTTFASHTLRFICADCDQAMTQPRHSA